MVLGPKMALVLRAKGGNNFMVQTRGIAGKTVQDAIGDALETLGKYAVAAGKASAQDGSGDAPPGFALGRVPVLQGRYLVTYRMVNAVLVLLVTDPAANAFLCLRALDAAAKVLVGACKGVDVTADRLSRKYVDVHAALGDLLSGGLAALPPAFVHASATDERLLAVPLSAGDAARKLRKLVATGGKGGSTFVPDKALELATPTPAPVPETPSKRGGRQFAPETADPLGDVAFLIPQDALPPPPARAAGARRESVVPLPLPPTAAPAAFQGAVQDDAAAKAPPEAEGFGAFGGVELLEAEKTQAAPEAAAAAEGEEWGADFAAAAAVAVQPAPPVASRADLLAALQLVEIYQGAVVGGELRRAGIEGAVRRRLAPFGLAAAQFRLLPSPAPLVNVCLGVASMNAAHTQLQGVQLAEKEPAFVAKLSGAPIDCRYLNYTLPSVACKPPLQVELIAAPQAAAASRPGQPKAPWQALILVRYAASPDLGGPLLDVVVDVDLPPEVEAVARASPAAQWCPQQCRLRWIVGRVEAGGSGLVRAVVAARSDVAAERAEAALAEGAAAAVVFTGSPGRALSGVGFEVGVAGVEGDYLRGRALWFGKVTARP